MSIETAAADQPREQDHSAFLGNEPSLDASEAPGTSAEGEEVEAGSEAQAGAETEVSETTAEESADYLPTEQSKIFPDAEIKKYAAKRYPGLLQRLEENPGDEELRQLLHDKINTDIFLKQQSEMGAEPDAAEEPTPDAAAAQNQPPLTPTQFLEQREKGLTEFVNTRLNQEVITRSGNRVAETLIRALGVDPNSKNKDAQNLVRTMRAAGPELVRQLAVLALDLNETVAPAIVPNVIERSFPGLSQDHAEKLHRSAYESVRKSKPEYAKLPDFDATEGSPFFKAMTAAKAQIPGFDKMRFDGMTASEVAKSKYAVLAKYVMGQPLNQAEAKAVYEAGQKDAKRANVAKNAGNLGAGQSKGTLAGKQAGAEDPLDLEISRHRSMTSSIRSSK